MTTLLRRLPLPCVTLGLATLLSLPASAAPPEEDPPPPDESEGIEAPADGGDAVASEEKQAPPQHEPVPEPELKPQPPGPEDDPLATGGAPAPDEDDTSRSPTGIGDKHSIQYMSLLAPRINPLGLEERLWIGYQYRLYNKNKTILNGSNIGLMFRPIINPAIALIGATFQFQPAAVFRFRATYSFVQWYGTFQYMQSYQSPHDDYSETRLDAQADAETNYVVNGHQVELEALVQAKVKNLAIRSTTVGVYNLYDLRGDDDLFYAVRYDILAPGKGWILTNDSDVLWLQGLKGPRNATLITGARATTVMPFYEDEVYEEGDVRENPNGPQFRLGPVLGYIFYDRPERYPRFNKPTLLMIPSWNIKHRWRTGRDVSTAMPTIVIAFVFSGQLWKKN